MRHETPFRRSRMTAALGLLAALFTLAPAAAHAAAVPQELTDAATADPAATFDVVVDSSNNDGSANIATSAVLDAIPAANTSVTLQFDVIDGLTAHLSGAQILALSDDARVSTIITPGSTVQVTVTTRTPTVLLGLLGVSTLHAASTASAASVTGVRTAEAP